MEDMLGVGVQLEDDGTVHIVLSFNQEQSAALGAQEAAAVGVAVMNCAHQAAMIEIEISQTAEDERPALIQRIRDRYSAPSN